MRESIPGSNVSLGGESADMDNRIPAAGTIADGPGPGQPSRSDEQVAR
ncbi:MAG: hypothetical protein HOQ36_02590 [Nocardia sp.]|nr:hypothetical protein [Nocardia sp.]